LSPLKADDFSVSRQQREAQDSPQGRDSWGELFLASSFGQTKEEGYK